MRNLPSLKIDVFSHILTTKYKEAVLETLPADSYWPRIVHARPALWNIEQRLRIMDSFESYVQVLTVSLPPVELILSPEKAAELARVTNDEMAELVSKYPDRFVSAVACLPMNNMDAALKEVDRAIDDLGFSGVQIFTPTNDKPLDSVEFMPLFEKMSKHNLPIWIHPHRSETYADYRTESRSMYKTYHTIGWPYETTVAMIRLVFSGILERYPNLKFITHHCGAMVPFFESRLEPLQPDSPEMQSEKRYERLSRPPIQYFKMFYADTANVRPPALICGHQFFGTDHLLFGTDMPYGPAPGDFFIRQGMDSIGQLNISQTEKEKILRNNAEKLLRLHLR